MKGIIFVELIAMAEDMLGEEVVDSVLATADLPSGGAYTSVGQYACAELVAIVGGLSRVSNVAPEELQRLFGHWMMKSFATHYGEFFERNQGALDMLQSIEDEIHVEVKKLYPDAELPNFDTDRQGPDALQMVYRSPRGLSHFCHGLIEGCLAHYDTSARIEQADRSVPGMTMTAFDIRVTEQP
jgi:hypothetical protein